MVRLFERYKNEFQFASAAADEDYPMPPAVPLGDMLKFQFASAAADEDYQLLDFLGIDNKKFQFASAAADEDYAQAVPRVIEPIKVSIRIRRSGRGLP